jgi:hypothetical protein
VRPAFRELVSVPGTWWPGMFAFARARRPAPMSAVYWIMLVEVFVKEHDSIEDRDIFLAHGTGTADASCELLSLLGPLVCFLAHPLQAWLIPLALRSQRLCCLAVISLRLELGNKQLPLAFGLLVLTHLPASAFLLKGGLRSGRLF